MRAHRIRVELNATPEDMAKYRRARPEVMALPPVRQVEAPAWLTRAKARPEVSTGRKARSADEMAIARALENQQLYDGTAHQRLAERGMLDEAELLANPSVRSIKAPDREPKSIHSPAPKPRLQFVRPKQRATPSRIGSDIPEPASARERPIPQPHGRVEKVMRANLSLNVKI